MTEMESEVGTKIIEPKSAAIDCESITDQVWHDMAESVPRPVVAQTVAGLLAKYQGGAIQTFVPVLVRREARELLNSVKLTEAEANSRN